MPPLGPRIGKHEVKSRDGIGRQHFGYRIGNLESEDPRIRQAALFELARGASDPSRLPFESEEITGRISSSDRREEGALPATKIDFNRSGSTKQRWKIERRKAIRRDDLARACYGWDSFGGHVK